MLEIDSFSFGFNKGGALVSSFSLKVEKGEKILILAPPGSGKSSLAKALTGSLKKYYGAEESGNIKINNISLLPLSPSERMKLVSRTSQDTDEMILFSFSENEITFPLENLGLEKNEIKKRLEKSLDDFGLQNLKSVSTSELSGGEKRRLALSAIFALNPEVFILDEAFDELSAHWRSVLREKIKNSNKTFIVLASHYLSFYEGLFSEVYTIKNKKVIKLDNTKEENIKIREIEKYEETLSVDSLFLKRTRRSNRSEIFSLNVPSFSLNRGNLVVLKGENGSGKSTFSKILSGILEEDRGKVEISGKEIKAKERRKKIAYLSQNPLTQLFLPKVRDELKSTGKNEEDVERIAKIFNLDLDSYVTELSFGKAKLVQAALFYLLERPFVILDEIDNALSYKESLRVIEEFLKIKSGLIVISHDDVFISYLKGKIYIIEDGELKNGD